MRCRDCGVCCTRTMRASYRDHQKAEEDDDGDRDCVLVVRAYGLRGDNREYVPGNQRRWEGVLHNQSMQPARYTNKQSSVCTWAGLSPVAPVAYQVILEPGIGQLREFEPRRVHTRINSMGLFLVHKSTCGKRESVSQQHSMKNRRAVGLLNPMRDKN